MRNASFSVRTSERRFQNDQGQNSRTTITKIPRLEVGQRQGRGNKNIFRNSHSYDCPGKYIKQSDGSFYATARC